MKQERKGARLRQVLDDTAEQMCLLSHLEGNTAKLLADEVVGESDVVVKATKLLHIMIDEISTLKMNMIQAQSSSTAFLYAMLAKNGRKVPMDGDELVKWIPAKMDAYRNELRRCKQVIERQQSEINALKASDSRAEQARLKRKKLEEPESAGEIARLKKELEKKKKKVRVLKQELSELKGSEISNDMTKEDFVNMRSQVQKLKGVARSLKKQLNEMVSDAPGETAQKDDKAQIDRLQAENRELAMRLENASTELASLREKYSIVIAELRAVKDENARLSQQMKLHDDAARERCDAIKNIEIEKDSLSSKLMDALNQTQELETQLKELTVEKERLSHKCIRLEATISKQRDETSALTSRFGTVESDVMNLQRFGFLLADALCEEFNPESVETELHRLLAIAKKQHSEPDPVATKQRDYQRIHTQFDELESQISALQNKTCPQ